MKRKDGFLKRKPSMTLVFPIFSRKTYVFKKTNKRLGNLIIP